MRKLPFFFSFPILAIVVACGPRAFVSRSHPGRDGVVQMSAGGTASERMRLFQDTAAPICGSRQVQLVDVMNRVSSEVCVINNVPMSCEEQVQDASFVCR